MNLTYRELIEIPDYAGRLEYARLNSSIGELNAEVNRYLNQRFYHTPEWRRVRNQIIVRDCGNDLAVPNLVIFGKPVIHHLNPLTVRDVIERRPCLFDPENLVLVSYDTHNAIHYGIDILDKTVTERTPGDTKLW